jgi:hypothetical protein
MDYTSMPIVEDESMIDRFRGLPLAVRAAIIVAPFLLLAVVIFAWSSFSRPAPVQAVVPTPVPPQFAVDQARVVNPQEIVLAGTTQNVADGTAFSARLLADGTPTGWISSTKSLGTVQNNMIDVRLHKADNWDGKLVSTAAYSVEVTLATTPTVTTRQTLVIPTTLANEFFGIEVAVVPTSIPEPTPVLPEPTSAPAPTPAPAPTTVIAQIPSLVVNAGATMLISPTLGSDALSTPATGTTFQPLLRTPDSQFFLVLDGNHVGWLAAKDVKIDAAQAAQVATTTPSKEAVEAGPLHATVWHGGNIRYGPSLKSGTVLGQAQPGDVVTIKASTADHVWYHIVAPAADGWIHSSLLTIDSRVAANVPRATP